MQYQLTILILGLILGFIGAGGSGVIITLLTSVFGVSIHIALGTSLLAMVLTTIAGTVSHLREAIKSVSSLGVWVTVQFALKIMVVLNLSVFPV